MEYHFDFYSGENIIKPKKPIKPKLGQNPTHIEAVAFANSVGEYEKYLDSYSEDVRDYKDMVLTRKTMFEDELKKQHKINDKQFQIIYDKAYSDGHDEGLQRVHDIFEDLYEMVISFCAAT